MKKSKTIIYVLALIASLFFYGMSLSFYKKGEDKITNYYNSENYPSLNVNAYVGGDAYNYIINSNYATGYYVLSMGFLITGTIFTCFSINGFTQTESKNKENENKPATVTTDDASDELPEL